VAREAMALGLEERRVRLDEATRDRLVRLFLAALAEPEHGLSKDQIEAAPRGLPAGGPSESIWPRAERSPPAPESREVDVSTTQIPLTPDELLTTTRAVRRRIDLDRPVDREVVEEVLEIALQAPTASNMQPWSFVVVTEPDKKAAIAEWYRKSWAAYEEMPFAAANLPYDDPARKALQQRVMDSATYLAEHFERMPVFVIPCLGMRPEAIDLPASFVQATLYSSVIQAAWSLQLAARARGLGSCWTTLHLLYEREIGEILGIPYEVVQTGLLTLGHAKGTDFRPGPREPLETKVHWEAW